MASPAALRRPLHRRSAAFCRLGWALRVATAMLAVVVAWAPAESVAQRPAGSEPIAAASPGAPVVEWLTAETRGRVGESRVLVAKAAAPVGSAVEIAVEVKPADALTILSPLRFEAGHALGYMRIRPVEDRRVTLTLPGKDGKPDGAECELRVLDEAIPAAPMEMVTPVAGATVWGEFHVGVRIPGRMTPKTVEIRAVETDEADDADDDGRRIAGIEPDALADVSGTLHGSVVVDADRLRSGAQQWWIAVTWADGTETLSSRVPVNVADDAKPGAAEPIEFEAEALVGKVPAHIGDKRQPRAFRNALASGGHYVAMAGGHPPLYVTPPGDDDADEDEDSPGPAGRWYQVAVVAAGELQGGARPTVGVMLDADRRDPRAATPLVTDGPHRVIVGGPVFLPDGPHTLALRFLNDRYIRRVLDRNLYVDRVELLPIDGVAYGRVEIAWLTNFDGARLAGPLRVAGVVRRDGANLIPAPGVLFEVNGKILARQHSDRPTFAVGTSDLRRGRNTFRLLVDLGAAGVIATPPRTAYWVGKGGRADGVHGFTAADPRWEGALETRAHDPRSPDGGFFFRFGSNTAVKLTLPRGLRGTCDMGLTLKGTAFQGPPEATVYVNRKKLAAVSPRDNRWRLTPVGRVELKGGDEVIVSFENDKFEGRGKDRNLDLHALWIRPTQFEGEKDAYEPLIEWQYPARGAQIGRADAVVVDVADAAGVARVDLLLNDQPIPGATAQLGAEAVSGRVCIPLVLRDLRPGSYRLGARVTGIDGDVATTSRHRVRLIADDDRDAGDLPFRRAVHFLNRFAYGPEPGDLATVLAEGPADYLSQRLGEGPDTESRARSQMLFTNDVSVYHITRRFVEMGLTTPNPARFRLLAFWENHFTTWIRKCGAQREWAELKLLDSAVGKPFRHMLRASATSPAMLFYLDNHVSFARRINENYAREIMELHTLGVDGGYGQEDVEQLARILTGWSTTNDNLGETFAFIERLTDVEPRVVIGYRFPGVDRSKDDWPERAMDRGETALEVLTAHPSTARFIAHKLAQHYLAVDPPAEIVDRLAEVYLQTDGDVTAMLIALLDGPAFWTLNPGQRGTDPYEFAMRLSRCGGAGNSGIMMQFLAAVERLPMDRVTPDGYPERDDAWYDTSSLLQRWRFAEEMAARQRYTVLPADYYRAREFPQKWNQAVIDALAVRLFGRLLDDAANAALLEILADASGDARTRIALALSVMGQLPIANLH
jgi:uncharacterized protein (DUF1800 family)